MPSSRDLAREAAAWPFAEARKLLQRGAAETDRPVVFQTGYGPSGLPHLGTFGEVARTSMVRHAFSVLSDQPTRLICFSDDMDGLRSVPDNVPQPAMLKESIGLPLSKVPDPFGTHDSFAAHNNARLCDFLDRFGFEYEFLSATEQYRSGAFDDALLRVLERHEEVRQVMLPTLGAERRATYSPFLPISPTSGRVLQVPIDRCDLKQGTITFCDEDGREVELPVTGGNVKLQWKPDWAMRWFALGVDYEMSGKDLIDSVRDSSKIVRVLGGQPPVGFSYEHFLDAEGHKISKSKGNGLSIEEWLEYAPHESLAYFMFSKPRTAKRLFAEIIPTTVDEYQQHLAGFPELSDAEALESAVWHVHAGAVPPGDQSVSFRMLVNLAAVADAQDKDTIWTFLQRYAPELGPQTHPSLDAAAEHAVRYFVEVLRPNRKWHQPEGPEREALQGFRDTLAAYQGDGSAEDLQTVTYEYGKAHWPKLRDWFQLLYRSLLGQDSGPRFGGFIAMYGVDNTVQLLDKALSGQTKQAE